MKKNSSASIAGSNALTRPFIPHTRAVRFSWLTGQRVEEIARLHVDQWDVKERIIDWSNQERKAARHSRP